MATAEEQKAVVKQVVRKFLSTVWPTISVIHEETTRDAPARGPVWISRTSFRAPSNKSLEDAVYGAIERLAADHQDTSTAKNIALGDVGVEFVGSRPGVARDAPEPDISEHKKLQALEKACSKDMTILYVHGGAML